MVGLTPMLAKKNFCRNLPGLDKLLTDGTLWSWVNYPTPMALLRYTFICYSNRTPMEFLNPRRIYNKEKFSENGVVTRAIGLGLLY